ncbi:unnamed protein product [Calypogeia fissa]
MKSSMEAAFGKALENSAQEFLQQQQQEQDTNVEEQQEQAENVSPQYSPSPPRQRTRRRRAQGKNGAPHTSGIETSQISLSEETGSTELGKILKTLHCCVFLAHVSVTEGLAVMQTSCLFPTVLNLHDSLVLLEVDTNLQESIAGLCELWWRENLEQKETLTVQCLPFLLSKALAWGKKKDVQRLYACGMPWFCSTSMMTVLEI